METNKHIAIPKPVQDLFSDLEKLKSAPITGESTILEKVLSTVPVRKPAKEWFFRTHPVHALDALVLELKEEGTTLILNPSLHSALIEEQCVSRRKLQLAINRQGIPFIWPMRYPNEGRTDTWALTAADAATTAVDNWVRMQPNMALGGYQISVAKIDADPVWPTQPFNELLRIAFKGSVVDSLDHPTLKQLRGES